MKIPVITLSSFWEEKPLKDISCKLYAYRT